MKKTLSALFLAGMMAFSGSASAQDLLAFPGAEGFGRYTKGARAVANPQVYHVTNLNDSGAGSLRDALSKEGRIIVFDVSGVINLKDVLIFKSNTTVLGQTAPGEGIQLYGNRVSFSNANNLIVRHLRIRMGVNGPSGKDAAGAASGHDMIFDHLSVLWGRDENFSISSNDKSGGPQNITIQNSIIGQGLQSHSCGGLIQTDNGVTLYRNLYIENKTRNPKVKGLNQYVNNVVYNWGDGGCYIMSGSEGDSWADIENNYFMRGQWSGAKKPFTRGTPSFRYYGAGNYYDDDKDGTVNGHEMTVEEMKGESSDGIEPYSTWFESLAKLNAEIAANFPAIQQIPEISNKMTAANALKWVIDSVGPSLPVRDEVDQYLIDELLTYGTGGTKNGISSEAQLPHKGTGTLSGGVKPLDTDNDGIPDEYETANGLNPNDASDAVKIAANGYTNIENYVNQISTAHPYIKKPTTLSVAKQDKTSLDLTWNVNKNTTNGFEIETSTDNGTNWTVAATVAAGTDKYTLGNLTSNTSYQVRLRATDGKGLYSDYSNVVTTETTGDPAAPSASVNPEPAEGAKIAVAGGVTLKWENQTKDYYGTVKYTVYIGTDQNNLAPIAQDITAKECEAGTLEADKTYYWRVDAKNDLGTTTGTIWSFQTTAGGVLFYADYYQHPESWFAAFGNIGDNTDVFNAANTTKEYDGMVIGSGANKIRVVAMKGANNSASSSSDYGPATAADAGASDRCVQFVTTSAGGYVTTPTVEGPCVVTLYIGNPETKAKTPRLYTVVDGKETKVLDLSLTNKKRVFKFTYTYDVAGPVKFKFDANATKVNINDFLVEAYVSNTGLESLELKADNAKVYAHDGNVSVTGIDDNTLVTVYDLAGRPVAAAKGETTFSLNHGLYIVSINGIKAVKVML
ncbi:MAG: fibronectin type III domain-containing protein [Muribaculaceae bacterium]|nr:fibronectin type III domain-containing protein [Muribaculaceae bacterium]